MQLTQSQTDFLAHVFMVLAEVDPDAELESVTRHALRCYRHRLTVRQATRSWYRFSRWGR
jgi:hypothetical protein